MSSWNWLQNAFQKMVGEKEQLNRQEYRVYNTLFTGYVPSDEEVDMLFGATTEVLPRKEVEAIVLNKLEHMKGHSHISEVFREFDSDFKGYIDTSDLLKAWKCATSRLSWKVLRESFNEVTLEGNLDYESFKNLCLLCDLM